MDRLKNGEFNLSEEDIATELDISVGTLKTICSKNQLPKFLIELSKNHEAIERFKQISDDWDNIDMLDPKKNFVATRERIKQIEQKAMGLLNKQKDNPPDDVA